ncbi:response regulator [Paenibacillus odorifer]|uniref:response regulator n=1 Tax=Paenibacillus odorifer TaxID=189426 RepID=UPI00096D2D2A|nr:response regulator [Paenibacillus odorifer]OME03383.1 response regulator [Paenibacillus odorifer]
MNEVYGVLELIKDLGIVENHYELYCRKCRKFTGISFETINKFPDYVECEECLTELDPIEDSIVIYKVIADE